MDLIIRHIEQAHRIHESSAVIGLLTERIGRHGVFLRISFVTLKLLGWRSRLSVHRCFDDREIIGSAKSVVDHFSCYGSETARRGGLENVECATNS